MLLTNAVLLYYNGREKFLEKGIVNRMKQKWVWICGIGAGVLCMAGIVSFTLAHRHKPMYKLKGGENTVHISLFQWEDAADCYVFTVNDPAPFAITHSCGHRLSRLLGGQSQIDYDIQVNVSRLKENTVLYFARMQGDTVCSVDAFRVWAENGRIRYAIYDDPKKTAEFEQYRHNRSGLESMA